MSKPVPPKALLDQMGYGPREALQSIICLMAALCVRDGKDDVTIPAGFEALPISREKIIEAIHVTRRQMLADLERGHSMVEIEHAIILYEAHLKAMGYGIETTQGRAN
jgi:hypothetical protein